MKSDEAGDAAPNSSPRQPAVAPASSQTDLVEAKKLAPYVEALERGLRVEPVKDSRLLVKETRLIDVLYKHTDPELAADVVNSIADVFAYSNYEKKAENNSTASTFLQNRVTELQAKIRSGEERLMTYAQNNQILSLDPNQNTVLERLIGLNRQLLEAENERKQAGGGAIEQHSRRALRVLWLKAARKSPLKLNRSSPICDNGARNCLWRALKSGRK
ncbi:MAG: hypothetical protein WKF84_07235 [Pyrinomonadaceae bacterium]